MHSSSNTKPFLTQREKLRALFDRHPLGEWIPLPEITGLGIAMYPPRIKELRAEFALEGFQIENKLETGCDGIKRSWYRKTRSAPISSFSAGKPSKSWEQVCKEREEKMRQPAPSFELVP